MEYEIYPDQAASFRFVYMFSFDMTPMLLIQSGVEIGEAVICE